MPKIPTETKKARGTKPPTFVERYVTVTYPTLLDERQREVELVLNLQICVCGHDRVVHSDFLGRGSDQVMVIDCPRAGRCDVKGCECDGFVFSNESSQEGKMKRTKEKKLSGVYPPEGK